MTSSAVKIYGTLTLSIIVSNKKQNMRELGREKEKQRVSKKGIERKRVREKES